MTKFSSLITANSATVGSQPNASSKPSKLLTRVQLPQPSPLPVQKAIQAPISISGDRHLKQLTGSAKHLTPTVPCLEQNTTEWVQQQVGADVWDKLLPYQKVAVMFLVRSGGRGLLALDMGLGKSLASLAYVRYLLHNDPKTKVLIVCRPALVDNWVQELNKWLSVPVDSVYAVYSGEQLVGKKRKRNTQPNAIVPVAEAEASATKTDVSSKQYVILSYDLAKMYIEVLKPLHFQVAICDECQDMKDLDGMRYRTIAPLLSMCPKRILLSGTPIPNKTRDLFVPLHVCRPDLFPKFYDFGQSFCDPKPVFVPGRGYVSEYNGTSNAEQLYTRINGIVMFRVLKSEFPIPSVKRRTLLTLDWSAVATSEEQHTGDDKCRTKRTTADILKSQVIEFTELERTKRLPKCLQGDGKPDTESFLNLVQRAAKTKAPLIRGYIKQRMQQILDGNKGDNVSGKDVTKVLIFAHHKAMIKSVCKVLETMHVSHMIIDGQTDTKIRGKLVRQFQEDDVTTVAVLSMKAAGAGLTLTRASEVWFTELQWNPADIWQAEDRAHRVGQTKDVNVEYWLLRDTVEERVWHRLVGKADSSSQVLNNSNDQSWRIDHQRQHVLQS